MCLELYVDADTEHEVLVPPSENIEDNQRRRKCSNRNWTTCASSQLCGDLSASLGGYATRWSNRLGHLLRSYLTLPDAVTSLLRDGI